jgi:pimeloyl-ACP methyl ester carboxylesterase
MQGFDPNAALIPDFSLTPFYEVTVDQYAGKEPGYIIKSEPVAAPEGSQAWRVMYVSRTWDDRLVPVTGWIAAAKRTAAKPRPILTWAHGTTGGNRQAAPSLAENPVQNLRQRDEGYPIDFGAPFLLDFLAKGYIVAATDYYGLGGPGVHHYVVGGTAGRNVLDIARAARNLNELNASSNVACIGWSQGGHAAIFTGEEQKSYAPELNLRGVVAIAPGATDLPLVNIPHLYVIARSYHDAFNVPLDMFTDSGKALIARSGEVSITGVFSESAKLPGPFFGADWSPAMKKAMQFNSPGQRRGAAPVLVVQGKKDNVVHPEETKKLEARARQSGNDFTISWFGDDDHRTVIAAARKEILEWLDSKLN